MISRWCSTVAGVGAMLALAGCADDNVSFFIESNVAPTEGDCTVDVGNPRLLTGIWNVEAGTSYYIHPVYVNQIRDRATELRSNPNGLFVTGAEIELRERDGSVLDVGADPNPFTQRVSGTFVPAGSETTPGSQAGSIEAIPGRYGAILLPRVADGTLPQIHVAVTAFGETNGQVDVEADEYVFVVNLCAGDCLFRCAAAGEEEARACFPGSDFESTIVCSP